MTNGRLTTMVSADASFLVSSSCEVVGKEADAIAFFRTSRPR